MKKILIVDDDVVNLEILEVICKNKGCETIVANNGPDAIKIVSEQDIGLVLMDIRMPKMSGLDATKEIKLIQPKLPILAVSAEPKDEYWNKKEAYKPFDGYIEKPIDMKWLKFLIDRFLVTNN